MSLSIAAHELIYVADHYGARGRLHHLAFWVDTREECLRAADVFVDSGVPIEAAPSKHGVAQGFFLYGFEPGGNRIEVTTGGYFVFDPDFEPITWTAAERARGQFWGVQTIESFHTYGTPDVGRLTACNHARVERGGQAGRTGRIACNFASPAVCSARWRGQPKSSQTTKATLGVRELVFEGELAPGERVPEIALAERLGVSRTPLRIALATLAHEGLLEPLGGGGFVVRSFTRADIADAIELRGVLEGTAARFAAERLQSPEELVELAETTDAIGDVVDCLSPESFVQLRRAERRLPRRRSSTSRRAPRSRARSRTPRRCRSRRPARSSRRTRCCRARGRSSSSRSTTTACSSRRSARGTARGPRRSRASTRGSHSSTSISFSKTTKRSRACAARRYSDESSDKEGEAPMSERASQTRSRPRAAPSSSRATRRSARTSTRPSPPSSRTGARSRWRGWRRARSSTRRTT